MSEQKIRLRYIRLPNRTLEFLDELVFKSDQMCRHIKEAKQKGWITKQL